MARPRIIETNEGIQGELTVEIFDRFAQTMRDKGWNNVDSILNAGITGGNVLEIGPGPGYVGLEWLKRSSGATLTGCEISSDMIRLAKRNARDYGYEARTTYIEGNCMQMPFPDGSFDAVFSSGSLHEWEDPVRAFNEVFRVLKLGGRFCIADLRRDVGPVAKWLVYFSTTPKEIRPGLLTSLNASYTIGEIKGILSQSPLKSADVRKEFFVLCIRGSKQ